MTSVAQLSDIALSLPEVQEGTHFRLRAFRVGDAVFVVVQSDAHVVLHVDPETAARFAAADPAVEQTYRGSTLIGVRVHLAPLSEQHLRELVVAAWRHRAPKRLRRQHQP